MENTNQALGNTITEYCPFCEEEVELEDVLKAQKCPSCGETIMPCSICLEKGYKCDFRWHDEKRERGTCRFKEHPETDTEEASEVVKVAVTGMWDTIPIELSKELVRKIVKYIDDNDHINEVDLNNAAIPFLFIDFDDQEYYVLRLDKGFVGVPIIYVVDDLLGGIARKLRITEAYGMTEANFDNIKGAYEKKIQELLEFRLYK